MKHFQRIAVGVDVGPLLHAVQRQPQLWNQFDLRTKFKDSPHAESSDIWVRFSDVKCSADAANLDAEVNDAKVEWFPAFNVLPQVRPILFDLMRRVEAYELGRVVITKLAPGKKIAAHADVAGEYANDPHGNRYHVVLQGLPGSTFQVEDEKVCMLSGECWWFDHRGTHEVVNNSADDRIHLLVDLRIA